MKFYTMFFCHRTRVDYVITRGTMIFLRQLHISNLHLCVRFSSCSTVTIKSGR